MCRIIVGHATLDIDVTFCRATGNHTAYRALPPPYVS
jgi:hypothetical protein